MARTFKVIQLLNLLSDKELNKLSKRLSRDKHKRLQILQSLLLKIKNKPLDSHDKAALFEKLFEETYKPEKDYLIRNEFRLLSKQIERVLVEKEIQEEMEKNDTAFHYYLLQSLQKRKALQLFQREYPKTYNQALAHKDYYAAHNITGLNFTNFTHFQNLKEKDLPFIERLNELQLTHLSCYYLTAFRQHQIDQQYIYHSLFPFHTESSHLEKHIVIDFDSFETDYSAYLFLKAKSFVVGPKERSEILKQCLTLARNHFVKNESIFGKEVKYCLSALARTSSLLTDFDQADSYFKEFFKKCLIPSDPERLSVLGDYIANCINLDRIDEAIVLLEENAIFAAQIPGLVPRWECLNVACYAFKEDIIKLSESLPQEFHHFKVRTKYFFRFYFAICAWLKGRLEEAYREIENMRHQTVHKDSRLDIHPIVNFFHRYFYTCYYHLPNQDAYSNNLRKLAHDIHTFSSSASPELRSYLPLLWLRRKLESEGRENNRFHVG